MPDTLHPEDEPLRSSLQDLDSFENSAVWHDMQRFLQNRKQDILQKMESPEIDVQDLRYLQGGLENVNDMLGIIETFRNELDKVNDG